MLRLRHALAALLVLALLAAPLAFAAGNGTYRGSAKDDSENVVVKVKDNRVTKFVAHVYASCGLSNLTLTVAYPPAGAKRGTSAKIKNGRFRAVFKGSPDVEDDKRTVTGRFSGKSVSGSVKIEGLCSADKQYSAKR
ncbi:MAG: hypothetical protein QOH58_2484 [Thermoleophilaceae bacterium]|nr:hypothetical protein [Thermoleophilaceae bacterium]